MRGKIEFEKLPKERQEQFFAHGKLNIKWDGVEEWHLLDEAQKQQKVFDGAVYETIATTMLPEVMDRVKSEDKVLVFIKSGKGFIGVGTCKTSIAKFWVGVGILETEGESYIPRILSPEQFKKLSLEKSLRKVDVDLIDIHGLEWIWVMDGRYLIENI